ncbi:MAG TPA: hypothetical protein VGE36_14200 [Roseateles sp.]
MNHYAEINAGGICFAQLATDGVIDSPTMVLNQGGEKRIGQRWTGAAWVVVDKTAAEKADEELRAIDVGTGLSRSAREVLIAVGKKVGADVAYLEAQEAKAAAARAKRGA